MLRLAPKRLVAWTPHTQSLLHGLPKSICLRAVAENSSLHAFLVTHGIFGGRRGGIETSRGPVSWLLGSASAAPQPGYNEANVRFTLM